MKEINFTAATSAVCDENNDMILLSGVCRAGYKTPLKMNFQENIGKVLRLTHTGDELKVDALVDDNIVTKGLYPALGFNVIKSHKDPDGVTVYDEIEVTSVSLSIEPNQDKTIQCLK